MRQRRIEATPEIHFRRKKGPRKVRPEERQIVRLRPTGNLGAPLLEQFYDEVARLMLLDMRRPRHNGNKTRSHAQVICVNLSAMLLDIRRQLKKETKRQRFLWAPRQTELENNLCAEDALNMKIESEVD